MFSRGSEGKKNSQASKWIASITLPHILRNSLRDAVDSQEGFMLPSKLSLSDLIRRRTREKMIEEPRVGLLASYERSQASLGVSGIFLTEINFQNHL